MDIISVLTAKPVLIGVHLGAAIIGIDAFMWLLGKLTDKSSLRSDRLYPAIVGTGAFVFSWLVGGYYYVKYYGLVVKPVIKAGVAPWAHIIVMESKEHIFLFIIPLAVTIVLLAILNPTELKKHQLDSGLLTLTVLVVGIGFLIGAFGFIISAAARWGA
ncbi:MAG: hypothetical protein AAB701_03110 [Patescibacteria group bacterium]